MVEKESVRILCLDDAPLILSALKRELEIEGYEDVTVCTDGQQALAEATRQPFDMYIVDQTMPHMLGTEFVERLSELHKNALVFILTGQDQGSKALQLCRQSVAEAGTVVHYFTKPWDTSLFIEMQRALETRGRQYELEKELKSSQALANIGLSARKLAHEIRNPLGVISGAAQLLENQINRFESSNQSCTEIIINEVNRLSNLLDDLSVYNKANQLKLDRGNINKVLSSVLDLLRIEGRVKGIQFEAHLDPTLPYTWLDARKLHQAFLNVGKNAIEAMETGGRLTIKSTHSPADASILICFTDTGAGIPPENIGKVFELFFTSKGEKGSGIGLAVTKQLVLAHGGDIWVDSEVGRGSTFYIRLHTRDDIKSQGHN